MRLFVTGGTGFIGSHFLNEAIEARHEVAALRRPGSATRIPLTTEPVWVEGELDSSLGKQMSGCDALVHIAAHGVSPQQTSWNDAFHWNVMLALRLFAEALASGVRHWVVIGSFAEYGTVASNYDRIPPTAPLAPVGAYATSKAASCVALSGFAREKNARMLYLRLFSVFGKGQHPDNLWPSLHVAAQSGRDYPMTPGEQVRDFIPAESAAKAILAGLSQPLVDGQPQFRNIGSGQPQTVRSFVEHWWQHWGARGRLQVGALPYRASEVMRYVPLIT
jgi:nucleoside-diphosphate-sugar epimerase